MTNRRWIQLMMELGRKLTDEETAEGWHFCPEWDGLLIGPGMEETCSCEEKKDD